MRFILRRLLFYAVAAFVALTINFFVPRLIPGNVVQSIMDKYPELQPSAAHAIEVMLGIGHQGSLWHQYVTYLGNVAQFKFGTDLENFPASVATILSQTLPWTIILIGTSTLIAFAIGTGLGILSGWRSGGWLERVLPALTFVQALPYFFLALVLIEFLAVKHSFFPQAQGYAGQDVPGWNWRFIGSAVYHSILPAFTIVVTNVAGWMLQMRNVMITTVAEDYVLAAQAKGLKNRRVILTYAARNAILPQLSGFANAIGFVVGGAILVELVFSYPGVGLTLLNAVSSNDYPMMQAIFLILVFAVLLANLLVDVVYVVVDPRARARSAS
jgi:peptide/nickel transport system permease protein